MGDTLVITERRGPIALLRLNYPERRNALSLALRAQLIAGLEAALADRAVRTIVLTGEGGSFCSGGDISSMEGITAIAGRERMRQIQTLTRLIVQCEKPVIAAVEGHAAGAGLCLAAACDIVVAAEDSKFGCSFNKIGLVPDLGAAWTLPLRMGLGKAKLLMLRGATIDAATAERYGLVEMLCAPGAALDTAVSLAEEMSAVAPLSNAFAKTLLARMPRDIDEMLRAEADAQAVLYTSEDFAEGRAAFMGKRRPNFTGA